MKRLDPVYKSLLNEVARDEFIPPWMDDFLRYPHQQPDFTKPIQRPTVKPNIIEPNVVAPEGFTTPGKDKIATDDEIRKYLEDWRKFLEDKKNRDLTNPRPTNPGQLPNQNPPRIPPGITLAQWLIFLATLFPWLFPTQTGGNPTGYPIGTGPDNYTGDYPPPFPPIYPLIPNNPIDLDGYYYP